MCTTTQQRRVASAGAAGEVRLELRQLNGRDEAIVKAESQGVRKIVTPESGLTCQEAQHRLV